MRVVALDLSLTATGVCDSQAPDEPFTLEPPARLSGMARLRWIRERVREATKGADLVVIEGYSHGSRYQAHYLGELGGVIRLMLHCFEQPYVDVAPSVRAKVATGSGTGRKDAVFAEAFKRLGYSGESKDEADARWLMECALQHYGLPGRAELPAKNLEPLAKSRPKWPVFEVNAPALVALEF